MLNKIVLILYVLLIFSTLSFPSASIYIMLAVIIATVILGRKGIL